MNHLQPKFSWLRLKVLILLVAAGMGVSYMLFPAQVVLLDPKDDDLLILNGCVVSACSYLASVRTQNKLEENFWSRVMLVRYKGNSAGHAYCVWETDGQIFGYDRDGGSFPIPGNMKDPHAIAESLAVGLERVMKKPMKVDRAEFIEPKYAKLYAY